MGFVVDNLPDLVLGLNTMWHHNGEFRCVQGWRIDFALGVSMLPLHGGGQVTVIVVFLERKGDVLVLVGHGQMIVME